MKPPSWIVFEPPVKGTLSEDGRSVLFNMRIRRWHPGLWLYLLRTLMAQRRAR